MFLSAIFVAAAAVAPALAASNISVPSLNVRYLSPACYFSLTATRFPHAPRRARSRTTSLCRTRSRSPSPRSKCAMTTPTSTSLSRRTTRRTFLSMRPTPPTTLFTSTRRWRRSSRAEPATRRDTSRCEPQLHVFVSVLTACSSKWPRTTSHSRRSSTTLPRSASFFHF